MPTPAILILILSAAVTFAGVGFVWAHRRDLRLVPKLVALAAALILALLLIRAALAMSGIEALSPTLFIDVMRAFSLDADYDTVSGLPNTLGGTFAGGLAVTYITLVYTLMPLIGGATLFNVIAGVSPTLRLWTHGRREIYAFSALNEASIALAEDIASRGKPCALIFAGVGGEEDAPELCARALDIDAILLPDDLPHLRGLNRTKSCALFLMRREAGGFDDARNVAALNALLSVERHVWRDGAQVRIFTFTDDGETVGNVRAIRDRFEREGGSGVEVNAVRDGATTAHMLLKNSPLYAPLGDFTGKPLRVALLGDGPRAMEMFLAVYWCGQMLDTPLSVVVLTATDGGAKAFLRRLRAHSPQLPDTCAMRAAEALPEGCASPVTSDRAPKACLRARGDAFNPPYCAFSVVEVPKGIGARNVTCMRFEALAGEGKGFSLADCDYFLIESGSDAENLALADDLRAALIRADLCGESHREQEGRARRVVAFRIEDSALSPVVSARYGSDGPAMCPFGSLRERFTWARVSDVPKRAPLTPEQHIARHGFADERRSTPDDLYNLWSMQGRQIHSAYKRYCAADDGENRFAWLEHRRWCAFLRAQGFAPPFTSMDEVIARVIEQGEVPRIYAFKDIPSLLHPCLVESLPQRVDMPALLDRVRQEGLTALPDIAQQADALDIISLFRSILHDKAEDSKDNDERNGLDT